MGGNRDIENKRARNRQHLHTQISRDLIPDTVLRLTGLCLHVCVHLRQHKFPIHRRKRRRGTEDEQPPVRVAGLWIDELMVTDEGNKELDVPPVTSQEPVWITHLRLYGARERCRGQPCPPQAHKYNETHTQTCHDFHKAAEQNCHTKQWGLKQKTPTTRQSSFWSEWNDGDGTSSYVAAVLKCFDISHDWLL